MKFDDKRLCNWDVTVKEVSAGVYRVLAHDNEGHTVDIVGEDPNMMLSECARAARAQMDQRSWLAALGSDAFRERQLIEDGEAMRAMPRGEYLVLYNYGQGGLWAIVRADSADQIRQRWPQLEVFDRRPAVMDDRLYAEVRGRGVRDLEAPDGNWLASLASATDSHGHVVTLLGRTDLRYIEGSRSMFVDSEMLARPNGIAVYRESISRWDRPHESDAPSESDRARILASIVQALRLHGLDVDLIWRPGPTVGRMDARAGASMKSKIDAPLAVAEAVDRLESRRPC